jgi:beta-galactosidase GanA
MRKRGDVIFVMNFTDEEKSVTLDKEYNDLINDKKISGSVTISPCSYIVIE